MHSFMELAHHARQWHELDDLEGLMGTRVLFTLSTPFRSCTPCKQAAEIAIFDKRISHRSGIWKSVSNPDAPRSRADSTARTLAISSGVKAISADATRIYPHRIVVADQPDQVATPSCLEENPLPSKSRQSEGKFSESVSLAGCSPILCSCVGTVGGWRRGWMLLFSEGGGALRWVTTTSRQGFGGILSGAGARSSPSFFLSCFSSCILAPVFHCNP
jgi:hypothetical protein